MRQVRSRALLVRMVPWGESDVIATFFTETDGNLGAVVRGARRSTKRFGGALEPIHEIDVQIDDRGTDLGTLKEAQLARVRHQLVSDLGALEAAGQALRWIRHTCPPRTPEPAVWAEARALLDGLDRATGDGRGAAQASALALFGLRLLADVGYGLELAGCVRCERRCPPGRSARIDFAAGGLVCAGCGGGGMTVSGPLREIALHAGRSDQGAEVLGALPEAQARALIAIVEGVMAAHTGFGTSRDNPG